MRNRLEERVSRDLGEPWVYEAIRLTYTVTHTYTPDFVDVAGKRIVETKGYFSPEDRRKMKAVRAQHPDWHITIVFQNPNTRVSKRSKTTYAGWCERSQIDWRAA